MAVAARMVTAFMFTLGTSGIQILYAISIGMGADHSRSYRHFVPI
ncbi:hypothetical protein MHB56_29895 [Paenibacillus sp. FSL H8-0315]